MNNFEFTEVHANIFIDKLYEIIGRKWGVKITRVRDTQQEKKTYESRKNHKS